MAKDPAILWYFNDWHGGTSTLSRHLKGCYMDILHAQFNNGQLSIEEIKTVLGSDFGAAWPTLQKKFVKEESTGLFYNERLVFEKVKRKNFTKSRSNNLKKTSHMENENENENYFFLVPTDWPKEKFLELLGKWINNRKKKPNADLVALRLGELVKAYPMWIHAEQRMTEAAAEGWFKFVYNDDKKQPTKNGHDPRSSETFVFDKA